MATAGSRDSSWQKTNTAYRHNGCANWCLPVGQIRSVIDDLRIPIPQWPDVSLLKLFRELPQH